MEPAFVHAFVDIGPLVAFVGENKLNLRRLSAIRQKGHYRDPEFMARLRELHQEFDLHIEFDGAGKIAVTPENSREVITALLDHRLGSPFSNAIYDVPSTTTIRIGSGLSTDFRRSPQCLTFQCSIVTLQILEFQRRAGISPSSRPTDAAETRVTAWPDSPQLKCAKETGRDYSAASSSPTADVLILRVLMVASAECANSKGCNSRRCGLWNRQYVHKRF
jgi:hypothetical protein